MKLLTKSQILITLTVILLSILISFTNEKLDEKVIRQENNSYYEINPCKVSIFDFLLNNTKSTYQNHYYFRPNDKTPINCYGKIAGVSVQSLGNETQFFIFIGTNSILNLLFQSILWVTLILFIPRSKEKIYEINKTTKYVIICSLLFTYSIFAENRFYEKNIYNFDFYNPTAYILIFLSFLLSYLILTEVLSSRIYNLLNYFPWIFLFNFIFSGFNLSLITMMFVLFGLLSVNKKTILNSRNIIYFLLSIWWTFNSTSEYFFKVGKLRGFTSSSYDLYSNIYWIVIFYLIINGALKLYDITKESFNFTTFVKNISKVSSGVIVFGLFGANFPIINFLNYYFFGLQRYVVEEINPFALDQYLERISWRGVFPSSETIGEFFGASLLILLFYIVKEGNITNLDIVGIIFSSLGLYFSDNKTSIVLVFLLILYYFFVKSNINNFHLSKNFFKLLIFIVAILVLYIVIGADNFQASYKYMSTTLYSRAGSYQFSSNQSTSLSFIQTSLENNLFLKYFFGLVSSVAFLLNRSIMWSLFFARYNPTIFETLFGTGPLTFGKLYGAFKIIEVESLLLPHSSVLSFLVFFGVIPLLSIAIYFLSKVYKNRKNDEFIIFAIYITLNVLKNDSLNYLPMFIFYFFVIKILYNKNIKK